MKNPRTILITVGALVLLLVGFVFVRGPKPIIEIRAEKLADIGPFPFVNTYLTSTVVVIVISLLAIWMTRNLTLIPNKAQNLLEAIVDAMYTICINTAGPENAKRFFPVVMTIFTFIWIANWMALLPFFNAIGGVQKVDAHHWHEEAVIFESAGPLSFINLNEKELEFEEIEAPSWADVERLDEQIAEAETAAASAGEIRLLEEERLVAEEHAREEAILEALHKDKVVPESVTSLDEAIQMIEADGKELGVLIPYFRSMNTDINSPLSIAIMAMIFVEFWGITALGFFKYGAKFLNFSSPINFIVGLLELVAEVARLISFTFRLFGNMLAGEILLLVMTFLAPFLVALPFYGLETFVGVIQAFVFAMLTLLFASLAVSSHEGHDELGGHDDPDRPLEGPVPVTH
ncbi:MAG: F0F1 ATP synthase subunit A [Dehalococcoidia bacterium]